MKSVEPTNPESITDVSTRQADLAQKAKEAWGDVVASDAGHTYGSIYVI